MADSVPSTPPPRPVHILDLPLHIKKRIFFSIAQRSLGIIPGNAHRPPLDLLPVYSTCPDFRCIVKSLIVNSLCSRLSFDPLMSWFYFAGWLRLASPGIIEALSFDELPSRCTEDDDDCYVDQIVPPSYMLDLISEYAPTLKELDMSGIQLVTPMDSNSLGLLLYKVRDTLTKFVVKDYGFDTHRFLTDAVLAGSLQCLVDFKVIALKATRRTELHEMLNSFRSSTSGRTALRKISIDVNKPRSLDIDINSFNWLLHCDDFSRFTFPDVEEVHYSVSSKDHPYAVEYLPARFILSFPDLKVLTLNGFAQSLPQGVTI